MSTPIPLATFATFYHATKSAARRRLVAAMYASQATGFDVTQDKYTSQVTFRWSRDIPAPLWAVERKLATDGEQISQSVELCVTGRDSPSILLRVYQGHCYNQSTYQTISMAKAVVALRDPAALLYGKGWL